MDSINMLSSLVNLCTDIEKIDFGYRILLKNKVFISYNGVIEEFKELLLFEDELILKNEFNIKSILKPYWNEIKFIQKD